MGRLALINVKLSLLAQENPLVILQRVEFLIEGVVITAITAHVGIRGEDTTQRTTHIRPIQETVEARIETESNTQLSIDDELLRFSAEDAFTCSLSSLRFSDSRGGLLKETN